MTRPVSLIGAPTDIGAGARGASMGPEALRVAGLQAALEAHGLDVQDRGNLAGPPNPWLPPTDGYRHLNEVVAWNQAVHNAVHGELAAGRMPILLGGDHCLAIGSISAVARHCREAGRKLRVLWLDAHADFNTSVLTPSGNIHGMPVACLCGHGPQELIEIGGTVPAISPKVVRQIGIRSVDPGEKRFVHQVGLEVFDMRYIDEMGMRHAMELALATMDANTHLHVSFDVDFLDPEIAPGVGTTIPGGPTYREAQLCMEMIADSGRLASLDIMELNPALDVRNKTAVLAVDLVESLFGKSTLMREPLARRPLNAGVAMFDITIVGAGIAGAALAHALGPQVRVLLLEREAQPGLHSTGRSAAMFMESYGPPQARALTRASRSFYTAPPAGFTDNPILAPRGALYVAWVAHAAALDTTEAELRATGTVIERLSPAEALARMPLLREHTEEHGALLGALWEPDAMDVDVHTLHQGYLRGARRQGAELWCDAELQQATREAGGWALTLGDGRQVQTRQLVNAAGAWADPVAQRCGSAPQGLQPKRRSAFTFDAPEGLDCRGWPVTAAIDERWYLKPDAGQLLGSPANADPVPPHDVVAEELDIATAIHHIGEDTALQIRRPRRTWAGLRTFSRSGELIIGADAHGLFWLAGQGGYGIQSAQGAALLAAGLLRAQSMEDALRAEGVDPVVMAPRA